VGFKRSSSIRVALDMRKSEGLWPEHAEHRWSCPTLGMESLSGIMRSAYGVISTRTSP
jgi:hypothetical protein